MATATILRDRFRHDRCPRRLLRPLSKSYLRLGESLDEFKGGWVGGDLTWRGDPSEFQLARDFIARLNSWAKLDNYSYALCPGNR